jgi:hypothetical protein
MIVMHGWAGMSDCDCKRRGSKSLEYSFSLGAPLLHKQQYCMISMLRLRSDKIRGTLSINNSLIAEVTITYGPCLLPTKAMPCTFPITCTKPLVASSFCCLLFPASCFSLHHPHTPSHPQHASQEPHQQLPAPHHKLITTTHQQLHQQQNAAHTGRTGVSTFDSSEYILSSEASIHHRNNTDPSFTDTPAFPPPLPVVGKHITTSTLPPPPEPEVQGCRHEQLSKHRCVHLWSMSSGQS